MATVSTADFKNGMCIVYNGQNVHHHRIPAC